MNVYHREVFLMLRAWSFSLFPAIVAEALLGQSRAEASFLAARDFEARLRVGFMWLDQKLTSAHGKTLPDREGAEASLLPWDSRLCRATPLQSGAAVQL